MTKIFSMAVALVMLLGMDTVCSAGASREGTASGGAAENEVVIAVNGTRVRAILYDNSAARSFRKLLPYSVSVTRAADDLCGAVSEELAADPDEDSPTWKIGEIGWFDGWFTILCDNEEGMRKRSRTLIGKISDDDIAFIRSLKGSVSMTVSLD